MSQRPRSARTSQRSRQVGSNSRGRLGGDRPRSARYDYNPDRVNPSHAYARRFHPNDTIDPYATHVPSTRPIPRETQSRPFPVLHSVVDEWATAIDPSYVPESQELLRAFLFETGATEDTLEEAMAAHNQNMIDACGGRLQSCGRKPDADDRSVMYYDIPDSELTIRI